MFLNRAYVSFPTNSTKTLPVKVAKELSKHEATSLFLCHLILQLLRTQIANLLPS